MTRYGKESIEVEAVQVIYATPLRIKTDDTPSWWLDAVFNGLVSIHTTDGYFDGFTIKTREGDQFFQVGDYIIRGTENELYPCKQEIFEQTYEKVL